MTDASTTTPTVEPPKTDDGVKPIIIRTRGLKKIYKMGETETHALRGVDAEIYRGEFVCMMGPSGSGKSTFFNAIGGLDSPSGGRVFIDEVDVAQLNAVELAFLRCRKIGYIFQTYNLVQYMTCLENVTVPMAFAGLDADEARERGMGLLELVGLKERWFHKPIEMSGGQQQRTAIARSMANLPQVLLCDEPTGNLDLKTGEEIHNILYRLNKERGVTIICVTHDHRLINMADRIFWIRDGEIERIANRSELTIETGSIGGKRMSKSSASSHSVPTPIPAMAAIQRIADAPHAAPSRARGPLDRGYGRVGTCLVALLAAMFVAGCSSTPTPTKEAQKKLAAELREVTPEQRTEAAAAVTQAYARAADEAKSPFAKDLAVLTKNANRLAGLPDGSLAAATFVEQRLAAMGVKEVFTQDFPVVQAFQDDATITVAGKDYPVYACRPNNIQAAVTPAEGLSGTSLYVGKGQTLDYGPRDPAGSIVLIDFDSMDAWTKAFAFGAKAVVFVGPKKGDLATPPAEQHLNTPANLPRFYMPHALADALGLLDRSAGRPVTVKASCRWKQVLARNVIGVIRGTDPKLLEGLDGEALEKAEKAPAQAVVLAAPLDSYSEVPALSPAARDAGNIAALLGVAEHLLKNPPKRDVILAFFDGQCQNHLGARAFYGALFREPKQKLAKYSLDEMIESYDAEKQYYRGLMDIVSQKDLFRIDYASLAKSQLPDADAAAIEERAEYLQDVYARATRPGGQVWTEARLQASEVLDELRNMRLTKRRLGKEIFELKQERKDLEKTVATPSGQSADTMAGGELASAQDRIKEIDAGIASRETEITALEDPINRLDREDRMWNELQRVLHEKVEILGDSPEARAHLEELYRYEEGENREFFVRETPKRFEQLMAASQAFCRRRLAELDGSLERAWQGKALQAALGPERDHISLHVSMNLGDARARWSFIHGDDSNTAETDPIGNYNAILKTMRTVAQGVTCPTFDVRPISRKYGNRLFAPRMFADSSAVARLFAIFNVSVMTVMDPLSRQGLPADRADVLDAPVMAKQLADVKTFLRALIDDASLNVRRKSRPSAIYVERYWQGGATDGSNVKRYGAGSARPDLPVANALLAVNPRPSGGPWQAAELAKVPPGMVFPILVQADGEGYFAYGPIGKKQFVNAVLVAATFDRPAVAKDPTDPLAGSRGLIRMISNTKSCTAKLGGQNHKVELFTTKSLTFVAYGVSREGLNTLAMSARSTAAFRNDRFLLAEIENILTIFAPQDDRGVKLFNRNGLVVLNNENTLRGHTGRGMSLQNPFYHTPTSLVTAHDLMTLNQYRLDLLRVNQIRQESLAQLNGRSKDLYEDVLKAQDEAVKADDEPAEADKPTTQPTSQPVVMSLDERLGKAEQAASLARKAYPPLVGVMNDLVTAVVLLLLLAIPFAYALERLFIGTPHIYRQILWFAGFFLMTFGILFLVNPAFQIAATPVIIFLAFTIILLSSLVMFIVIRKLQAEIKKMQGLATTVHSADVSRLSTMMAAVNMGISTMRRRALRTTLTAITVILLTFTILTFASFGSSWGAHKTYVGPMSGTNRMVTRHQLWSPVPDGVYNAIRGALTGQAIVVPRYWVSPTAADAAAAEKTGQDLDFLVARENLEEISLLSAAIGLDSRDIARQPALQQLLRGKTELLDGDGVFLTEAVAQRLGLGADDVGKTAVLIWGRRLVFAGHISDRMSGHLMLDESKMLPVNYAASAGGKELDQMKQSDPDDLSEQPDVENAQFVEYNVDTCAIVGVETARQLGGTIRMLTTYPDDPQDTETVAVQIAEMCPMPTYYGWQGGVYRTIFRSLTEASGWRDLLIPVLLGGLIVFATMLGSVSDREREIYTFSSLGLAPMHVGGLFFAEAGVYAVVGGMGGYLLGQIVARLLAYLASWGWISVPSMNYSSTNAIVTILIVMGTVLISTVWPAIKASRSANPGIQRAWRIPKPAGSLYDLVFPFTVSAYDITGVVSFLREHFENCTDSASGKFATLDCHVFRQEKSDLLGFYAEAALVPYDLGVTQRFALLSQPSEIEGIDEVRILIRRISGTIGDWRRGNRVFVDDLRKQLLIWRSLPPEVMDKYRQKTLDTWSDLPREHHTPDSMGGEA